MKGRIIFLLFWLVATMHSVAQKSELYQEPYRPQYHYSTERNWMGEPTGLIWYEGAYHLYFQVNPNGTEPGYYHWGHAVSEDLVHWKHLPVAIFPDDLSEEMEKCTVGPGSIVVDEKNHLGLQDGNRKTLVAFYTSLQCGQRIAYSQDGGSSWKKYSGNPVIAYDENEEASAPRVFWYKEGNHWVMAIYRKPENDDRLRGISFYTSDNLKDWTYQSHLAGFRGAPEMVEMKVNNRPDEKRWILFEGDGSYVMGSFDGKSFLASSIRMKSDFGKNYYGTRIISGSKDNDDRILQISWMKDGTYPDMPFSGQMTFPSELSLKMFNNGIYLIRQPAKEIEVLQGKKLTWENENLIPGLNSNLIKKAKGEQLRIKGQFDLKTCDSFGLMLRMGKKETGTELMYNVKRQALTLLGQTVSLEPVDNKIYFDILIDRSSVEVYANNGRAVITAVFNPAEGSDNYILYNTGGELLVDQLEIFELSTIWPVK